jgi:hypothetical protein
MDGAAMSDIDALTEDEAMTLFHTLKARFGWAGTVFTRADAELEWQSTDEALNDESSDAWPDMPDDVWNAIQDTWQWRKGIANNLTERGWDMVTAAVAKAIEVVATR